MRDLMVFSEPIFERTKAMVRADSTASGKHDFLVRDSAALARLLERLDHADAFAFDTETTGLDLFADRPIGIGFAFDDGERYYVPLVSAQLAEGLRESTVLACLAPSFRHPDKLKIGHHLKFEMHQLANVGIDVALPYADSMIASHLVEPDEKEHSLERGSQKWLGSGKLEHPPFPVSLASAAAMTAEAVEQLARYCMQDAGLALALYRRLSDELKERALWSLFIEVEMPLVAVLWAMEREGVFVESWALAETGAVLAEQLAILEQEIWTAAGEQFNINSPKQLGELLFDRLKLQDKLPGYRVKKTKSGYATNGTVLEAFSWHPLPRMVLDYRELSKLKSTFIDALPKFIHPRTGRLHTSFHQTGTATGRLSSSNPNLQNIPLHSDIGLEIRKAFRAERAGHVLIDADYSQIELRVLAHLASEAAMIEAFQRDEDIYTATAARLFRVSPERVSSTERNRAKTINIGIIYGQTPFRLAHDLRWSLNAAKGFIARYFKAYPGIEHFIAASVADARVTGYSTSLLGRRRPVPGLASRSKREIANAEKIAVNSRVQGSAADLIKLAMIQISRRLAEQGLKTRLILQVHDELLFEAPDVEAAQAARLIRETMEQTLALRVPLKVDLGVGANWLEAHFI